MWYYKDRAGLPRGPCQLTIMRACWVNGVIDDKTLVWGQGLEAWYPIRNVVGLVTNIQSLDGAPAGCAPPLSLRRRLARGAWRRHAARGARGARGCSRRA